MKYTLVAHLNPASALKWASSAAPFTSAVPAGVCTHSVLVPYSDSAFIGVLLEGSDGAALKEGAKTVVGVFKDAVGGGVGKEELARAVARAKSSLDKDGLRAVRGCNAGCTSMALRCWRHGRRMTLPLVAHELR